MKEERHFNGLIFVQTVCKHIANAQYLPRQRTSAIFPAQLSTHFKVRPRLQGIGATHTKAETVVV